MIFKLLVLDPFIFEMKNDEAKKIYYSENENRTQEDKFQKYKFSILKNINQDICGWIFISNSKINYPVVQANVENPEFYLKHNYKREISKYGSIFAGCQSQVKETPKNTILYGHHMNDGEMFADLMKFSDLDFYKKNPIICYDTEKENAKWKIFSILKTNTLPEQGEVFQYAVSKFKNKEEFQEYINQVKKRSLIDTKVDVNEDDFILTLSTCSYEFKDFRTVVVARKVRQEENEKVDIFQVEKAKNPLMPRCWYEKYGNTA